MKNKNKMKKKNNNNNKLNENNRLNLNFITGLTDGEGCFYIGINKNSDYSMGWVVVLSFQIGLDRKDRALLEYIQFSLNGVGSIVKQGKDMIRYRVSSVKDLQVIIDNFDKYPLITQKQADYFLFKRAFELVKRKEHLTIKGFHEIIAIKASMNLGLSEKLKQHFPNINPLSRPVSVITEIKDPYWLAGFTEGEGCFLIMIQKSPSHKIGYQVRLRFSIGLHSRDELVMKNMVSYLGCGKYYKSSEFVGVFLSVDFSEINDKIIPFFKQYSLKGAKSKDFDDFCKVAEIMKVKGHTSEKGLEQIRLIKMRMNRGRARS
jgi:hypothetical protein